jgi:TonB family protein
MPVVDQLKEPEPATAAPGPEFHVESLLLELQDERDRGRHREAVLLSVIVHLVIVILLLVNPKIFHSRTGELIGPADLLRSGRTEITYLESPLKTPKPPQPVHSNIISDRDRFFNRHDKVVDSISAPPVRRQPPARSPEAVNRPPAPPPPPPGGNNVPASRPEVAEQQPPPEQPKTEVAQNDLRLQDVPKPADQDHTLMLPGLSAESQMQRAMEGAARSRISGSPGIGQMGQLPSHGGFPGGQGQGSGTYFNGATILSDTQGVDFAPYLARIVHTVKENWYAVMPEVAYLGRKGRVVIIFKIQKNGHVPGLSLVSASGTESLDRAALAAISASNPFPPLPDQFGGPGIVLQFSFFYNYPPNELPQ